MEKKRKQGKLFFVRVYVDNPDVAIDNPDFDMDLMEILDIDTLDDVSNDEIYGTDQMISSGILSNFYAWLAERTQSERGRAQPAPAKTGSLPRRLDRRQWREYSQINAPTRIG